MKLAQGMTNSWFFSYIGKTEATIIISVLVIIATSFFIRAFYFAQTEEFHQPGYMSNRQQRKLSLIREYLGTFFFVGLWCYALWIATIETNSIFVFLGSIEILSVFLATFSLIFTLIFIFLMVGAFKYILPITFHGAFILTPVAILVGTYKYFSAVPYAYPGAVLLSATILLLYLFSLRYFYSAILSISSISSVVLFNFRSIMRMFIPFSLILFAQIFIICSIFNSRQSITYVQEAFLLLLLMWTMEIYSYFCKAFFASTTYLTLSGQSDVYSKSMKSIRASLPSIIYAALIPAFLLSLQSILSKLSSGVDKTSIAVITPLLKTILRILTYIIAILVYILESYNDIVIPYIGIYGGGYTSATSDKANSIPLKWSNKLLYLPRVKDFIFFPIALIVGIHPFLLDYLSESSIFGFNSIIDMFFSTTFTHGFGQVIFTISPKVLFVFFTVYAAFTFFTCLQSALYAKACFDHDKPLLKPLVGATNKKDQPTLYAKTASNRDKPLLEPRVGRSRGL